MNRLIVRFGKTKIFLMFYDLQMRIALTDDRERVVARPIVYDDHEKIFERLCHDRAQTSVDVFGAVPGD